MTGHSGIALAQTFAVQLHQASTVDLGVLAAVPFNGHIAQSFFGSPPVVSHHHHKIAHVQHFDNATTVIHLAAVHAHDLATKHRRLGNGSVQHTGQLGIDTEANLAGHDVVHVHPRNGFASQGPGGGVFQRHVFGRRQFGGVRCQLAIAQGFLAGCMYHFAQ